MAGCRRRHHHSDTRPPLRRFDRSLHQRCRMRYLVMAVVACMQGKRTECPSLHVQRDDKLQGLCLHTTTEDINAQHLLIVFIILSRNGVFLIFFRDILRQVKCCYDGNCAS